MVKSCMRIPCPASMQEPLGEYAWGLAVPARIAQELSLPVNEAVLRLPPRKTFFYHFSGAETSGLNLQELLNVKKIIRPAYMSVCTETEYTPMDKR